MTMREEGEGIEEKRRERRKEKWVVRCRKQKDSCVFSANGKELRMIMGKW